MKILYFSPIFWDDLKQRPQHLAEGLSKYYKVIFIEPNTSIFSFQKNIFSFQKKIEQINENLTVLSISRILRGPKVLDSVDFAGLNILHEKIEYSKFLEDDDIIWLGHPIYVHLAKYLKLKNLIIYDKMDDFHELNRNQLLKKHIKKCEEKLLALSDYIFYTSNHFFGCTTKKYYHIPNGLTNVPKKLMNNISVDNKMFFDRVKKQGYRIYGYVGTIDWWFDFNFIQSVLELDEKSYFTLIGRNNVCEMLHPRVSYLGIVPQNEVYGNINMFDICIYPFIKKGFVDSIDPVKIYEYLFCNKIIVALDTKSLVKFGELIYRYKHAQDINSVINSIITENIKIPFNDERERSNFISMNAWSVRVKKISEVIDKG